MNDDLPKHKYIDGKLVELTQDEIDAIMAERGATALKTPEQTTEKPHGPRRTK
jgi:hypothetical protein